MTQDLAGAVLDLELPRIVPYLRQQPHLLVGQLHLIVRDPAMDTLSPEILAGMGEFFARKQPDLDSLTYHDMQNLLDNSDAASYAALSRSCRYVYDSCAPSLDKYQDEAFERFERHVDLNQDMQECDLVFENDDDNEVADNRDFDMEFGV